MSQMDLPPSSPGGFEELQFDIELSTPDRQILADQFRLLYSMNAARLAAYDPQTTSELAAVDIHTAFPECEAYERGAAEAMQHSMLAALNLAYKAPVEGDQSCVEFDTDAGTGAQLRWTERVSDGVLIPIRTEWDDHGAYIAITLLPEAEMARQANGLGVTLTRPDAVDLETLSLEELIHGLGADDAQAWLEQLAAIQDEPATDDAAAEALLEARNALVRAMPPVWVGKHRRDVRLQRAMETYTRLVADARYRYDGAEYDVVGNERQFRLAELNAELRYRNVLRRIGIMSVSAASLGGILGMGAALAEHVSDEGVQTAACVTILAGVVVVATVGDKLLGVFKHRKDQLPADLDSTLDVPGQLRQEQQAMRDILG